MACKKKGSAKGNGRVTRRKTGSKKKTK